MFLNRDHRAGFFRRFDQGLLVDRLDRVVIDDHGADALFSQLLGSHQGFVNHRAACDDRHIGTIPQAIRLANLERRGLIGDNRHFLASEPHIGRTEIPCDRQCRLARFHGVRRDDDTHVGQTAHHGDFLERLVGRAVRSDRDAAMCAAQFDIQIVVADGRADLIPGAAGEEHAVVGHKRDLAHQRKTGRHAHLVLLSDTDAQEAVRELFLEPVHADRRRDIRT